MIPTEDRIEYASLMIREGKIKTVESLYQLLTKKAVAEILGLNITRFTNVKSHHPGDFKIREVKKLSEALNVDLIQMVQLIDNSLLKAQ
ncbi:hypothetical protein AAKU52_002582 [Pedobacter sp. CG_S7]|uniref:hypothetical protein n=1 Tax=Pedobacter sp. CG_S7 TaxID=3143930 RepID=UPI0033938902